MGVVIVAYGSAPVIGPCLDSLLAQDGVALRVVVVDNASPDDSAARVEGFARNRRLPFREAGEHDGPAPGLTLLRLPENRGFAAGVNAGLRHLLREPGLELFWVLNPDCIVAPGTAAALARTAEAVHGRFALIGGRTVYTEPPGLIQSDGARVSRLTAVVRQINRGLPPETTPPPDPAAIDMILGASMLASRRFVEAAGPLPEDYFLYYEEVAWAFRRGGLPLLYCPQAVVRHHAGSVIGTGSIRRRPTAFANYFNFRNRMRFAGRHMPGALPGAWAYSMAKIAQMLMSRAWDEAWAAFCGLHQLPPPRAVAARLTPNAPPRGPVPGPRTGA